jgi:hypothetical protein
MSENSPKLVTLFLTFIVTLVVVVAVLRPLGANRPLCKCIKYE